MTSSAGHGSTRNQGAIITTSRGTATNAMISFAGQGTTCSQGSILIPSRGTGYLCHEVGALPWLLATFRLQWPFTSTSGTL